MELSVYMELSRLSGRLYGDSGRLYGTTLAAVAKNGKALDFFQGVDADKGGDAGGYIFRRADRNANACDATLVGHGVRSNEVSKAIL